MDRKIRHANNKDKKAGSTMLLLDKIDFGKESITVDKKKWRPLGIGISLLTIELTYNLNE